MIYVGIDWADEHHDVCIVDSMGKSLAKFRFENDYEGFIKLGSKIQKLEINKDEVAVSIETTHGLVVAYLLDLGYTIYPINPMAAERARDRYKVTGVKNNKLDAWSFFDYSPPYDFIASVLDKEKKKMREKLEKPRGKRGEKKSPKELSSMWRPIAACEQLNNNI